MEDTIEREKAVVKSFEELISAKRVRDAMYRQFTRYLYRGFSMARVSAALIRVGTCDISFEAALIQTREAREQFEIKAAWVIATAQGKIREHNGVKYWPDARRFGEGVKR